MNEQSKKIISITGKTNKYSMRKLTQGIETKQKRKNTDLDLLDERFYDHPIQNDIINAIYYYYTLLEPIPIQYVNEYEVIIRQIDNKLSGYMMQDKIKKRLDNNKFITTKQTIETLKKSELLCYYCKSNVFVIYQEVREYNQWTLDRIDNDKCHSQDNIVIACLECNLNKRRRGKDDYKFTKQLVIEKTGENDIKKSTNDSFEDVSFMEYNENIVSSIEYSQDA